jgi:1,4-dihydroxy-2-naphthoyl-CoA hydrolase
VTENHSAVSDATTLEAALTRLPLAEVSPLLNQGFCETIGLEYLELTGDRAVARWTVGAHLYQPAGIVNGGVYCTVIETVVSTAGTVWIGDRGHVVGVNNNTDFLRAVRTGTLTVTATPVHRGRTQQLWQAEIRDEQDRLVSRGQVRLANIENTERLAQS